MGPVLWQGWETVGLIGSGSFGSVYEIRRTILDVTEKAALKVITIPKSSTEVDELYNDGYTRESVTEFYRQHLHAILSEYTTMRKLNGCENVVNCQDVHYEHHPDGIGWNIYIKMELLTALPKAFPHNMPEKLVIKLGKDMCRALQMCKVHGVLHRDIKPQNILVSRDGQFKLGDFGVAKTAERTTGGTRIGTYKYMAPEVYNNQPYGAAADIYSLGLVLYWLLNDRRMPFLPLPPASPSYSDEERAKQCRFSGVPIPAPRNGSAALKQIVLKACAFRPQDRFAGPDEMLAALESLERGPRPVVAAPPAEETTVRVRPPEVVPDTFSVPEYEEMTDEPETEGKDRPYWLIPIVLMAVLIAVVWFAWQNNLPATNQGEVQRPQLNNDNIDVGDVVYFGMYERDNDTANGQEQLMWQVLEIRDGKALVVSAYILESRENWNSNAFLNDAFTAEEQDRICFGDSEGKVFFLSAEEAESRFYGESGRRCKVTAYARANGVWDNDDGYGWWQLRDSETLMGVSDTGAVLTVTGGTEGVGVRPAMWITLDAQ